MKEKIQELYDGLQDRLKSPYILTFIIVWSIHHWRLIFILLTFDSDLTQGHKVEIAETYIFEHDGWWGMIWPSLLLSFASISLYYIFTILTKIIGIGYNWALAATYSKLKEQRRIITKEEYNELETKLRKNQSRVEELQKRAIEVSSSLKEEELKFHALHKTKTEIEQQNDNLLLEIKNLEIKLSEEITKSTNLNIEIDKQKDKEVTYLANEVKSLQTIEDLKKQIPSPESSKAVTTKTMLPEKKSNIEGLLYKIKNSINSTESFKAKFFVDHDLHIKKPGNDNQIITLEYIGNDTLQRPNLFTKYVFTDIKFISPNLVFVTYDLFTSASKYQTHSTEILFKDKKFYATVDENDLVFIPKN
jgi:uncharacterized protein YqgV (UPF0045/DUF77 family)